MRSTRSKCLQTFSSRVLLSRRIYQSTLIKKWSMKSDFLQHTCRRDGQKTEKLKLIVHLCLHNTQQRQTDQHTFTLIRLNIKILPVNFTYERERERKRESKEKKYSEWVSDRNAIFRHTPDTMDTIRKPGWQNRHKGVWEMIRIKHTKTTGTSTESKGRKNNGKQCQQLLSKEKTVSDGGLSTGKLNGLFLRFFFSLSKTIQKTELQTAQHFWKIFFNDINSSMDSHNGKTKKKKKKGRKQTQ